MQQGLIQTADSQNTKEIILKSIRDNNVVFVTAQPDTVYFHWQVEIYLYKFAKQGVSDRCYALIGYDGDSPSEYAKNLATKHPGIKFYKDTRKPNTYVPSIRPHILAKFFKEYPDIGKNVFYHDSDIFLTHLPRFDYMLQPGDTTGYVSDTISYIGYNYIKECSKRYKSKYPNIPDDDIFYNMCDIVGIDYETVKNNEKNSGGAQYLLKNIDYKYWEECEEKCYQLYEYLSNYEKKYPIGHHIQKWTTDMWVVLWLYWKRGNKTIVHKELDFSWATGSVADYNRLNIFHLAGITGANCQDKFHKGKYTTQTVFDAYIANISIFNHINKNNATYEYVNVIKEYITNVYLPERGLTLGSRQSKQIPHKVNVVPPDRITVVDGPNNKTKRFRIKINKIYAGVYVFDESIQCCGRHIWRHDNGSYIIFWSGSSWILTFSKYEAEIGPECGGVISSQSHNPYDNGWNVSGLTIDLL